MTTTVNISLPREMYKDAKRVVKERRYASVSELVRESLRKVIYNLEEITENGFPVWFEDRVLEAVKEPIDKSKTIETNKDLENWFAELHKKVEARRNAKN